MYWYKKALKKYAQFGGRARRAEYWLFTLTYIVIVCVLVTPTMFDVGDGVRIALYGLVCAFSLAMIIPTLAVTVRRLHDTDHSGWYYFISAVPIIGQLIYLVWMVSDGDHGTNKYGPDPKAGGEGA